MKNIWRLIAFVAFLAYSLPTLAQTIPWRGTELIRQNILTYHFRFGLDADLNVKGKVISDDDHYAFEEFWSKKGNRLQLDIKKSASTYPVQGYDLFEVQMKYRFETDSGQTDKIRRFISSEFGNYSDYLYLVAYNKADGNVKFISGSFFKSQIADDFKVDAADMKSFIQYLKLRGYNYRLTEVIFDKRKKDVLYFTGRDEENSRFVITVSANDVEQVEIKEYATKRVSIY